MKKPRIKEVALAGLAMALAFGGIWGGNVSAVAHQKFFTVQPTNQTVKRGQTATFTAQADPTLASTYATDGYVGYRISNTPSPLIRRFVSGGTLSYYCNESPYIASNSDGSYLFSITAGGALTQGALCLTMPSGKIDSPGVMVFDYELENSSPTSQIGEMSTALHDVSASSHTWPYGEPLGNSGSGTYVYNMLIDHSSTNKEQIFVLSIYASAHDTVSAKISNIRFYPVIINVGHGIYSAPEFIIGPDVAPLYVDGARFVFTPYGEYLWDGSHANVQTASNIVTLNITDPVGPPNTGELLADGSMAKAMMIPLGVLTGGLSLVLTAMMVKKWQVRKIKFKK